VPPTARELNIDMAIKLTESTIPIAEIACGPRFEASMVLTTPIITMKNCSINTGITS
jgi:hypothetical protein